MAGAQVRRAAALLALALPLAAAQAAPKADASRNDLFAPGAMAPARAAPAGPAQEAEEAAPEAAAERPAYRPRASAINPLSAVSLDELGATRERPLFSPSRRPPPPRAVAAAAPEAPPPPPPPPAEPEPPQFKLIGVVHGEGVEIGLFSDPSGKITRARVGEDAQDGWTVRSVEPRLAVVEREERQATLELAPRDADLNSPSENAVAALDQPPDIRPGVRPPPSPLRHSRLNRPRNAAEESFE